MIQIRFGVSNQCATRCGARAVQQYVNWERSQWPYLTSDDDFFRNPVVKGYYKVWIMEMASHVKSADKNHLLEVGLERFYGQSTPQKKRLNPSLDIGTDFDQTSINPFG